MCVCLWGTGGYERMICMCAFAYVCLHTFVFLCLHVCADMCDCVSCVRMCECEQRSPYPFYPTGLV